MPETAWAAVHKEMLAVVMSAEVTDSYRCRMPVPASTSR